MIWLPILLAVIVIFQAVLIWGKLFEWVTVYEYEAGLKYLHGQYVARLEPGRYRLRRGHAEIRKLELRAQYQTLSGQEILSSDHIQVKISLVLGFEIADPVKALHGVDNYQNALYLQMQLLLREAVQQIPLETLLAGQAELNSQLAAQAEPVLAELGLRFKSLAVKDIMLPGDLRRAYAQVLKVQKEAQAGLEKARGEQATLRSLANAARMLEKNPSLLNLRLIQSLENSQNASQIVFQHNASPSLVANASLSAADTDPA